MHKLNYRNIKSVFFPVFALFILSGCKKLVEVDPPVTSVTGASVYGTDVTAISVLTGLFGNINRSGNFASGAAGISLLSGLSADEFTLFSGIAPTDAKTYYYKNSLYANASSATPGTQFWYNIYPYIYVTNSAIEGLTNANNLTPAVHKQLLGEAKFMRAFFYFYLVNFYGDLPLALTTDYSITSKLSRASKADVYQQIVTDLMEAEDLLSDRYLDGTLLNVSTERTRPTKWAAKALLARVHLFNGNWTNAEAKATELILNSSLFSLSTLSNTFLRAGLNNNEAIFQLQPVNTGWNTEDARVFVINGALGNSRPIYLSQFLKAAFEVNDNRRTSWVKDTTISGITYSYPYKYKLARQNQPVNEYLMVLRLGEQYLIRAEARAMQGKYQQAIDDINIIRLQHGGLAISLPSPSSQSAALNTILRERQVELFSEWGHRWLDLKRTGTADAVMSIVAPSKGGSWQTTDQLYPIPLYDIDKNPKLTQNSGY